jgi:type I restriction enzyme S subunit
MDETEWPLPWRQFWEGGGTMNIDKSNWASVYLGDVVHQIKDQVDAFNCGLQYYLGGEHFNTNDLHVNGRSEIVGSTIGPAFIMRFIPNDVLLVSRNPHLRKMAVADFNGICSNVTYVLRSDTDILLQEYLPFVIRSSDFWNFAMQNKRGSTNFYLNWSDFEKYKFKLPPLNKQKRIAELLWTTERCRQNFIKVHKNTDMLLRTFVDNWILNHMANLVPFAELWSRSPQSGCSAPETVKETNHFVLSLSALTVNGYKPGQLKQVVTTDKMINAKLNKGDFLISRSNTAELVGLVGIYNENRDNVSFPDTMMRLSINTNIVKIDYLEVILLSSYCRKVMKTICAGTSHSMKKINRKTLGEIVIPLVSIVKQKELIQSIKSFTTMLNDCTEHENNYKLLLDAQIKNLVGDASDV